MKIFKFKIAIFLRYCIFFIPEFKALCKTSLLKVYGTGKEFNIYSSATHTMLRILTIRNKAIIAHDVWELPSKSSFDIEPATDHVYDM